MLDEDCHMRLVMRLYSGAIGQAREQKAVAVEVKPEQPAMKPEVTITVRTEEAQAEKPQPIAEKPEIEPRQTNHSNAVQLTLLDLWGDAHRRTCQKEEGSQKRKTRQSVYHPNRSHRLRLHLLLNPSSLQPKARRQSRKMPGDKATLTTSMQHWTGKPIRPSTASMKR